MDKVLQRLVGDLQHDLGKRIALNARSILQLKLDRPLDAEDVAAIRRDILETKRTQAGIQSSEQLWIAFKQSLDGIPIESEDENAPDLPEFIQQLDEYFAQLKTLMGILQADASDISKEDEQNLLSIVLRISDGIRTFHARIGRLINPQHLE